MKSPPDVAYYYPAPYWIMRESDWVKSLLLFFDKVSILLPRYMYGRHEAADPTLAGPLEERGLLDVMRPETWIDKKMSSQLATIVMDLLERGAFDDLPKAEYFAELSQSRIGYGADVELAASLVGELQARNLARPSDDGVSIPLHPDVRKMILVLLAQLSRVAGFERGVRLHPVTNAPTAIQDLAASLSGRRMPSYGRFVKLDLEAVSFDLRSVPLEDILRFRADHTDLFRTYIRDLHGFLAELTTIDSPQDREAALRERRQEISDAASQIRRATTRQFGQTLGSWSLGIAGAWVPGGALGKVLEGLQWIWDRSGETEQTVTAYQYLFAAEHHFR